MSIQAEFNFASAAPVLTCLEVRKGKDNQFASLGCKKDWWTEVFPFVDWVEKECVLNKKYKPYNNCYKVKMNGKIKYYFIEIPKW